MFHYVNSKRSISLSNAGHTYVVLCVQLLIHLHQLLTEPALPRFQCIRQLLVTRTYLVVVSHQILVELATSFGFNALLDVLVRTFHLKMILIDNRFALHVAIIEGQRNQLRAFLKQFDSILIVNKFCQLCGYVNRKLLNTLPPPLIVIAQIATLVLDIAKESVLLNPTDETNAGGVGPAVTQFFYNHAGQLVDNAGIILLQLAIFLLKFIQLLLVVVNF